MVISLKHKFVSSVTEGSDSTKVRTSNWNDDHDLLCATAVLLGRTTAGAGVVEELSASAVLTMLGLNTTGNPQFATIELGHASDTTIARSAAGVITVEGVEVVTLSRSQTLTNKTLTGTKETVFGITDGAAFEIDPANGGIQTITLGASRTPKATNFAAGQSVLLMVLDGTAYTLTWTDATFGGSGVVWVGGSAPTLDTTKYTCIELWKVGTQVYGAYVGAA